MEGDGTFEKPVRQDCTVDFDWKLGEIDPKERGVALRHIRKQRANGMPKEYDAYEVAIKISVNGRHCEHLGVTAGVPAGKHIPRKKILMIAARLLMPFIEPSRNLPDFNEKERFVIFGRDNI